MEEDFKNRRLKRSQQEQYNAGVQSLRAIFDQLNPQEQSIARLLYGLDGERIHSREEILKKHDMLSMSDLTLLDIKIERMMRIQKKRHGQRFVEAYPRMTRKLTMHPMSFVRSEHAHHLTTDQTFHRIMNKMIRGSSAAEQLTVKMAAFRGNARVNSLG